MCDVRPEQWIAVPGFENYQVSTAGRVRSPRGMIKPWKFMGEYRQLRLHKNGTFTTFSLHALVQLAFVGPRQPGMETRHLDNNPAHNCLENLKSGTRSENVMDEVRAGTHHRARVTHCPQGHPYSGNNLYNGPTKRSDRRCRECARQRDRARYLAKKQAAAHTTVGACIK